MSEIENRVRELLQTRVMELDDEKNRVERAIEALRSTRDKNNDTDKPAETKKRSKRRKRGGKTNRINQAIDLVSKSPGISGSDIAKAMKIKPNYLYRVLNKLVKEGRLKKEGRNYFPVSPVNPDETEGK